MLGHFAKLGSTNTIGAIYMQSRQTRLSLLHSNALIRCPLPFSLNQTTYNSSREGSSQFVIITFFSGLTIGIAGASSVDTADEVMKHRSSLQAKVGTLSTGNLQTEFETLDQVRTTRSIWFEWLETSKKTRFIFFFYT